MAIGQTKGEIQQKVVRHIAEGNIATGELFKGY
jgi:hypothetical protein